MKTFNANNVQLLYILLKVGRLCSYTLALIFQVLCGPNRFSASNNMFCIGLKLPQFRIKLCTLHVTILMC